MRRNRKAKILATLGPASSSPEMIEALFRAGADVFRLNFSHGTHADHKARYDTIREVETRLGRPIGVLVDLQGPKLRVGDFKGGKVILETGASFRLDRNPELGDETRVELPHPEIFAALKVGTDLLADDGKIRFRVEAFTENTADVRVINGGPLSNHKGVNVPGVVLPISALTEKDLRDLDFGLQLGADWIAMSFVQRPADVAQLRDLVKGRAGIVSKLEKPAVFDALDEIIELSDAVMVARGDLGVECPTEDVPILQKRIVAACGRHGKPVIVATQMLESMITAPTPTRAEASDVATAIYDGADTVMLSAESASGQYPIEAVTIMDKIISTVERDPAYGRFREIQREHPDATAADAISLASREVATTIGAKAIITYTSSGFTTLRVARQRPEVPIICLTTDVRVARRLALLWGAHCVEAPDVTSVADMVQKACAYTRANEFAASGDRVVIVAGVPFGTPGTTNNLRIAWIDDAN